MYKRILWGIIVLAAVVCISFGQEGAVSTERPEYVPPALTPAPYLIRDPAVREQLKLSEEQAASIRDLCDGLDEHLFALRDQPPVPSDPKAIEHVRAVAKAMELLPTLLEPSQQKRLEELALQFEGAMALFRSVPAEYLGLSEAQKGRMQAIYRQSLRLQEELKRRLEASGDSSQYAQQAEQIQIRLRQQFLLTLTESQLVVWQRMLGEAFDFSQTSPLSFRAPEVEQATGWFHTKPLSMKKLSGSVAAVIFCTLGSRECAADYPVYKLWARQYNPKELVVLVVHTPPSAGREDSAALQKVIQQEGLEFPIAVDGKKAVWGAWSNTLCPSVYLVDKVGRVRYWWYGPLQKEGATGDQWLTERIEGLRSERYTVQSARGNK